MSHPEFAVGDANANCLSQILSLFETSSNVNENFSALYHEKLISKALRYGTRWRWITQFYLSLTRLSTSGMKHTCLYSPTAERHRTLAGTHFPSRWG